MTDIERLERLRELSAQGNGGGNDSTKRSAALEVLAGPPDYCQTDRLVQLAIAILKARML
jgi:hypothetical protein